MSRPTWDEYFMGLAIKATDRATCDRAKVGAVIVKKGKYPVSTGYNGANAGEPHCDVAGHDLVDGHCTRAKHAERNAISIAELEIGVSVYGMTIYTTHAPCLNCAKMIAFYGIFRVVYLEEYSPSDGLIYLAKEGVKVERIENIERFRIPS